MLKSVLDELKKKRDDRRYHVKSPLTDSTLKRYIRLLVLDRPTFRAQSPTQFCTTPATNCYQPFFIFVHLMTLCKFSALYFLSLSLTSFIILLIVQVRLVTCTLLPRIVNILKQSSAQLTSTPILTQIQSAQPRLSRQESGIPATVPTCRKQRLIDSLMRHF